MLYSCQISGTCEKRMVSLNCYEIKSILDGIDFITSFPQSGRLIQPRSDFRVHKNNKFRIYYTIDKNSIKIISFSKNRDYSELLP